MKNQKTEKSLWKGIVAGAAAGLVATFVMTKYQNLSSDLFLGNGGDDSKEESVPATVKAANAITENVLDYEIKEDYEEYAGQTMHYLMGGVSGAIYGATTEYTGLTKMGGGFPFGTAVWAIADDLVVPALGLSKPPTKVSLAEHAYALSSHWVYGAVSALVRKSVRKVL